MRRLALRAISLLFAIGAVGALVIHASVTSGCTKTEPVAKDPEPATLGSVPPPATAAASAEPTATPAAANETSQAAPSPPAPNAPVTARAPQPPPQPPPSGRFVPATKSGLVFEPKDVAPQQQNAAPTQERR